MFDADANLVLRWLASLSPRERAALAERYARRLLPHETSATGPGQAAVNDPVNVFARMLFADCAASLGLSPMELHGLLHAPRRHVMQGIAWLGLQQIQAMERETGSDPSDFPPDGEIEMHDPLQHDSWDDAWDDLPPRIIRRLNDFSS